MLHPDVQLDAQRAIDQACPGRLPSFADYNDLPLVHAIVQETLRWKPVVPLSEHPPFTVWSQDRTHAGPWWGRRTSHVYAGQYIWQVSYTWGLNRHSKQLVSEHFDFSTSFSEVISCRAILHDEETYPRPDEFSPYRFLKHTSDSAHPSRLTLDPDIPDPSQVAFGFGRRVCPGQFMAYEALWIAVASVLAVFNITPAKDAHGELIAASIEPEYGFSSYVICSLGSYSHTYPSFLNSSPRPFRCVITPRSAAHAELIVDSDTAA